MFMRVLYIVNGIISGQFGTLIALTVMKLLFYAILSSFRLNKKKPLYKTKFLLDDQSDLHTQAFLVKIFVLASYRNNAYMHFAHSYHEFNE